MGIPILWRYLLLRYVWVLVFCTIGFIVLLLTMRLGDIAHFATLGAGRETVALFIAYQIPYILPIALPISCLISAILLTQKLSADHELAALRAQGASLTQIFTPIWTAALFAALLNFYVVSEVATRTHLQTGLLKAKALSVNPLLLLHNKHLMRVKGGYFTPLGDSQVGKKASEALIAFPDKSMGRMRLFLAKSLENKKGEFKIKDLSLVTGVNDDGLLVENTHLTRTAANGFSELLEVKVWNPASDQLPMQALVAKPNYPFSEIMRRISIALAALSFTFLGTAFGIQVGREASKIKIFWVICLAALFLVSYFIAKGLEEKTEAATLLYLTPHIILVGASLWMLQRVSRGKTA